jgi:hypothetical protein
MWRALAVACACLLAVPATVSAEWHITPMVGLTFAGKTTIFDPDEGTGKRHPDISGSVALIGDGIFGVEGITSYTPRLFQSGDTSVLFQPGGNSALVESSHAFILMGNVVVAAPRRWTEYFLRPFVSGGFGLLRVSKHETLEIFPTRVNALGYNIGGGAIGFLTRNTGVRFDLRYYSTVKGTEHGPIAVGGDVHVRYMTASIGLVIRPGRAR